jgi:hypothetical protein
MTLWWIPIGVVIVGGLALAGILAIFLKPVRERFWKPVGHALRWPFRGAYSADHRLVAGAKQAGIDQGRAEALAEIEAERAVPLVKPNWTVTPESGRAYRLSNTQSGVSISEVALSAPTNKFAFDNETQWPGSFDQPVTFGGYPTDAGREDGVPFTVRYRDTRGDWRELPAFLDREFRPGIYY